MEHLLGAKHEERIVVDDATAVSFLSLEGARVLGTPWMILWMERTSRNAIYPLLPAGWDSVGTVVNVAHVSAAGMGAPVTFRAEVSEVKGRRVWFRVVAEAAHGIVGEGVHERALIDVERFAQKVAANLGK
ncbi:MAG: thioesterase [Acidobacteria bacterium]|nr:thioesterase [Acidobacteriota bacterium]